MVLRLGCERLILETGIDSLSLSQVIVPLLHCRIVNTPFGWGLTYALSKIMYRSVLPGVTRTREFGAGDCSTNDGGTKSEIHSQTRKMSICVPLSRSQKIITYQNRGDINTNGVAQDLVHIHQRHIIRPTRHRPGRSSRHLDPGLSNSQIHCVVRPMPKSGEI